MEPKLKMRLCPFLVIQDATMAKIQDALGQLEGPEEAKLSIMQAFGGLDALHTRVRSSKNPHTTAEGQDRMGRRFISPGPWS